MKRLAVTLLCLLLLAVFTGAIIAEFSSVKFNQDCQLAKKAKKKRGDPCPLPPNKPPGPPPPTFV